MRTKTNAKVDEILDAARSLFRQKGFHLVSMSDIASAADIPRGSIYYYVSSKDDLLFEVIHRAINAITSPLERICDLDLCASEKLRRAVFSHVRTVTEHLDALIVSQNETRQLTPQRQAEIMVLRDRYELLVQQILREGIDAGEFSDDVDVKIASFSLLGMCNWLFRWYRPEGPISLDEIAETFTRVFYEGISKGRQRGGLDGNHGRDSTLNFPAGKSLLREG